MIPLQIFDNPDPRYKKRRYDDWLNPPTCCDVCKGPAVMVHNGAIYGRPISQWPWVYFCLSCAAYVGVHQYSIYPKGKMADRETTALRREIHAIFDPLWQNGRRTRSECYAALSAMLCMPPWTTAHIAEMDLATCKEALHIVRVLASADDFGKRTG